MVVEFNIYLSLENMYFSLLHIKDEWDNSTSPIISFHIKFQLWNMGRGPENEKCLDYENIYTPSLYAVMHYKLESEY